MKHAQGVEQDAQGVEQVRCKQNTRMRASDHVLKCQLCQSNCQQLSVIRDKH